MKKNQLNTKITSRIRSNRDMAMLAVSLLLSVLALYLFAGPTYSKEKVLEKGNEVKRTDLASKKQLLGDLQNFNKENADLMVNSKKLASFIPSRNNFEDFFAHIKEMAKTSNLEVVSFKMENINNGAAATLGGTANVNAAGSSDATAYTDTRKFTLNQQQVSFSVKGDYDNIINFSKVLENSIPFIQEKSVKMTVGNNAAVGTSGAQSVQSGPVILTSAMTFNFYYY
jgi:hypothetical protein